MLNKFRSHQKKILWALAIIIIPAFVMWGSLKGSREDMVAQIAGRKINMAEFQSYLTMAKLYFHVFYRGQKENQGLPPEDAVKAKAQQYLLLLWKAGKEKVRVSDREVFSAIKQMASVNGKFNESHYNFFLSDLRRKFGVDARAFEEYIRNLLRIDKLLDKYIKIEINDGEIKNAYRKDTQKAKISYIFIPYEKFKNEVNITENEINDYYNKNKKIFTQDAKIKIKYAIVNKDTEKAAQITKNIPYIKSIDELKNKFSVEVKETGLIGLKDPIEGFGWQPEINKYAFSLKKKQFTKPLYTNIGYLFLEKEDEKAAYIPTLAEIKKEVEAKLKDAKEREKTKVLALSIIERLKKEKVKNIVKTAAEEKVDFKETGYFKYYDYIEGLGLSEKVSKIVFSSKKDDIYTYPILTTKGAYIVQLKEITPFDETDFSAKRETFRQTLLQQKTYLENMKFLAVIAKEARFKTFGPVI